MDELVRVKKVEPLHDFVVRFTFTNGSQRDIDLSESLHGPIFEPMLRDRSEFLKCFVDPESQTIAWPNGADLDPDVLYLELTPAWKENSRTRARSAMAPAVDLSANTNLPDVRPPATS